MAKLIRGSTSEWTCRASLEWRAAREELQELRHGEHLDAVHAERGDEGKITLDVVVARDEELSATRDGSFEQEIVLRIGFAGPPSALMKAEIQMLVSMTARSRLSFTRCPPAR